MAASTSAKPAPRGDAHAASVSSNKRLRRPDHEEKPEVQAGYIQELMGQKTISMTVRYSHRAPTHLQEAVERLSAKPTDTTTDTGRSGEIAQQRPDAA